MYGKACLVCAIVWCCVCGGAEALPQDWPCEAIEVAEVGQATDVGDLVRVTYAGERGNVRMKVDFYAEAGKTDFDCGNQGCSGEFENVVSGEREAMDFYCEEREEKHVFCYPVNWRVWRLDVVSGGHYAMTMCDGRVSYTLNLEDCDKEQCVLRKKAEDGSEQRIERKCVLSGENGRAMVCVDRYEYEGR